MANVLLSLGEGMLTDNLGIPIIFVCTKSDYIDVLERERGFKDEDFDFIQRTLRSICLRFGASLIYTSLHRPETVSTLYHYLVSRLLSTPMIEANDQGLDSGDDAEAGEASDNATPGTNKSSSQRATASAGSRYLFRHRANIVDRDRVIVPAGWDSIAKIRYLRDSFDVTLVQSAWKQDEERYCKYIKESKMLLEGSAEAEATIEAGGDEQSSLVSLYGEVVPTPGRTASASEAAAAAAQAIMTGMVVADGDQDFMEKLFAAQEERMRADGEEPMGGLDVRSRSSTVSKFMSGLKARATEGDATGNVLTTAVDLQDQQQQQQQQQPPPPLQPSSSSPVALATATAARSAGAGTTKSTAHKPAVNVSSGFEALRSKLGTSAAGDVSGLVSGWGEESQRTTPAGVAAASMASSAATIRTGVIPSRTASASRRTSGIGTPTGSTTPAGTSGTTVGAKASTRTQELNSFFQNLLGKKGTAMSAGGAAGGGTGGGAGSPRPTVGGSGGAKATTAGGGDSKSLGGDS
ncbi:hypothetical protein EV182_002129 [Spiromyces aspiralis]|uniref:Uncharacterized protein n=1 Tax=Spiromyces aspiralis TaxID=68401 RepID=A0ACC1HL33_9FUNG|nr:hypothetical protein EV182_002129 [Spiromyces aspiralis]